MSPKILRWPAAGLLAIVAVAELLQRPFTAPAPPLQPSLRVAPITFGALDGWGAADVAAALPAMQISCAVWRGRDPNAPALSRPHPDFPELARLFGVAADWQSACARIEHASVARAFFEDHFIPLHLSLSGTDSADALFTGYFEPTYAASPAPTAAHTAPVLTRPEDLIMVDLGKFRPELTNQRIAGRIIGGNLVPYEDHAAIAATPPSTAQPLAYIDPNDLLFLQIQGSGRLALTDGRVMRVGYAAQNGHPYVAVGRTLVREGHMDLSVVTMDSIRAWLMGAPAEDAARIRHSNPSYVFFRLLDNLPDPALGPLGAQGVQLTPRHSIAIDPSVYPYGAPVWLDVAPIEGSAGFSALTITQDTGGAIRGIQRADIFFGSGDEAAARAGAMKNPGQMFVLVPVSAYERWANATP